MVVELTPDEVRTLRFYLTKALIDAEGMQAIGMTGTRTVENLRSVIHKLEST